jgi:hypothetical protein
MNVTDTGNQQLPCRYHQSGQTPAGGQKALARPLLPTQLATSACWTDAMGSIRFWDSSALYVSFCIVV